MENNRAGKKWMAIYTMPRNEKKVHERLAKSSINSYCPVHIKIQQWSDRKKKVEIPLFTSYVFVQVGEKERLTVLETPGVRNFVFWLGKPAVIKDEEIAAIKRFLNEYDEIEVRAAELTKGQRVEITHGQFIGQKGKVQRQSKKKVQLLIESLGIELIAEIDKVKVQAII